MHKKVQTNKPTQNYKHSNVQTDVQKNKRTNKRTSKQTYKQTTGERNVLLNVNKSTS